MSFEIDDLSRMVEVGAGLQGGGVIICVREATHDGYKVLAKSPAMTPEQARDLARELEAAAAMLKAREGKS